MDRGGVFYVADGYYWRLWMDFCFQCDQYEGTGIVGSYCVCVPMLSDVAS